MIIICFFNFIIKSISNFKLTTGHHYQLLYENNDIQVFECETCGKIIISYKINKKEGK